MLVFVRLVNDRLMQNRKKLVMKCLSFLFAFSLDSFVCTSDVREHVCLAVEGGSAEVTLVRPLVGMHVHVVAKVLQGVEPAGRITHRTLVRLET